MTDYRVQTFEDMNREAYEFHNGRHFNDVAQQSHYVSDGVEPIDLIRSLGILAPFCQGNIIKYTARYDKKNGLEDLKKAQVYLGWLIELVEGE